MWQYYRDEPPLDKNGNIIDFPDDGINSASFKFKQRITEHTRKGSAKDVEIMVPLKYLSNFWRTLEMPLINCEIRLQLKWSWKFIIVAGTTNNQNPTFQRNDTKRCVLYQLKKTQSSLSH